MPNTFQKARKLLAPYKTRLKEGRLMDALAILQQSMETALSGQLTAGEAREYRSILEKAVYAANFDQRFRQICSEGLVYETGKEKRLLKRIMELVSDADRFALEEAEDQEEQAALERLEILNKVRDMALAGEAKKLGILVRKTVKSHAADFAMLSELGETLMKRKLFDEAADCLMAALDVSPEDVMTLNRLGACLRQLKKHERAAEFFNQAIRISPDDEALMFNAARNAMDGRMWTEAYETLKRALEINPDFAHAQKALKAVEKKIFL